MLLSHPQLHSALHALLTSRTSWSASDGVEQPATIRRYLCSRDKRGVIRREKQRDLGNFFRSAQPLHRRMTDTRHILSLEDLWRRPRPLQEPRRGGTNRDSVHPNATTNEFCR